MLGLVASHVNISLKWELSVKNEQPKVRAARATKALYLPSKKPLLFSLWPLCFLHEWVGLPWFRMHNSVILPSTR